MAWLIPGSQGGAQQTDRRAEVLTRLAEHLWRRPVPHTLRVAVEGPDAAGKTRLADDLARVMGRRRDVIRIGVDGFHRPAEVRRRRGALSPEGYYRDSFDHDTIVREVLCGGRNRRGNRVGGSRDRW